MHTFHFLLWWTFCFCQITETILIKKQFSFVGKYTEYCKSKNIIRKIEILQKSKVCLHFIHTVYRLCYTPWKFDIDLKIASLCHNTSFLRTGLNLRDTRLSSYSSQSPCAKMCSNVVMALTWGIDKSTWVMSTLRSLLYYNGNSLFMMTAFPCRAAAVNIDWLTEPWKVHLTEKLKTHKTMAIYKDQH